MSDRHDAGLGDLEARTQAATTFDRPVTVEAGAGTGKTTLLIHRLLVWTLDIGWQKTSSDLPASGTTPEPERTASRLLDRIVAITFTEAAAAELADRFVTAIAGAAHNDLPVGFQRDWLSVDDPTLADRARWLLPQVDRAHITTIHAWCYEVLRRHPYDAGIHPELEIVADAQEIEAVAREVIEEHYRRAYQEGPDADLLLLGEEKLGPREWVEVVRQWVVAGWNVDTHLPDDDGVAAALELLADAADQLLAAIDDRFAGFAATSRTAQTLTAVAGTAALANEPAANAQRALDAIHALWRQGGKDTHDTKKLAAWAGDKGGKKENEALAESRPAVVNAASNLLVAVRTLKYLDPDRWSRRQRVLRAAILETEAALHDDSAITFGGLLRQASHLLTEKAGVAVAERARIDLLMVDEFQDTDGLQARLVEALALSTESDPSLIVVGDPKQSIYGWRNADLETYERIRRRVIDRDGVELILSSNFRSTSTVLAATDALVGSQMHLEPGFQPHYHALSPDAEHATDDPAPVALLRFEAESVADQARREAEWVARDIAARKAAGELTLDQSAILMRSKTHVRAVLRALRAEGLAYEVSADVGFHERSEVIDGAAWVRVIADPEDQVALLKVLRSPTVGMPDAALAAAWKPLFETIRVLSRPDPGVEAKIRGILAGSLGGVAGVPGLERIDGWVEYAAARLAQIGELRHDLRREPFAEFIDRLRQATDIEVIEARRPEGEARVANLGKLFDQLIQQVEETGGDTHAVLRVLRRGIYFELPAEEAVPLKPIDGAVQVASIHAAKGLEFDHLYLVHFGMGGGRDDTDLQVETAIPGATIIKGVAHPQWALGQQRRKRVAEAESLRLLYVALTRARRRLVVCLPTRCTAGTLGHLVEGGLAAAGRDVLEAAVTERTVEVEEGGSGNGIDSADREPLPNPAWRPPPDPPRLHDSPTRGTVGEGLAPSLSGNTTLGDDLASSRNRSASQRGTAIHHLLADVDLDATPPDLPAHLDDGAREFWKTFPTTQLGRRLLTLGDRLRGREVEVLTPANLLDPESRAAYASGKVDLVYVDEDGRWAIGDYKTGEPENFGKAVDHYAPQLRYYGRALARALDLDQPPRLELWFLDLDRIELVDL